MRFITFKTIEAKNFLSIGDNKISVSLKPGVNAIIGTNLDKEDSKNGCGKSTICDALYYALYGSTLREIGKDFIANAITKKRCEVSLTFDVNTNNETDTYKIVRKLDPTKCQLFKNDEEITRSTLAKTNALIQGLLRTPATVFQNSVIMSVNNALPFMALPKTDKRKFIESVLGLEVFTSMVLKVRDDYSILKKDYDIAYSKFEDIKKDLDFNKSQLENYELNKKERINKQTQKKIAHQNDIETLKAKIIKIGSNDTDKLDQDILDLTQDIEKLESEQIKLQGKLHIAEAEISSETKQIKKLQADKDTCPTCKRDYSEEHVSYVQESISSHNKNIETFQKAKDIINKALLETKDKINDLKASQRVIVADKNKLQNDISENNNTLLSIKHLENNLVDIEVEIQNIEREHNNELKGKIATLVDSTSEMENKVNNLNNELNVLETVKFVISEEGIKSFIVKKILKVLNSRLAFYLKKLEANCLCRFNEFFDEEIIDETSQVKSYFNFSGGERKRIDLACLFAFADIRRLQGDVNFSTVFYDELLDSSLDDKGVSLTLKALRERYQEINESCYIITHRGPAVTTKAEHIIHVVKQNGLTTIK